MKNKSYIVIKIILFVQFIFLSGCATVMNHDGQPIYFSSEPQGATVKVNGIQKGVTPTTILLKASNNKKVITYELDGFRTRTFELDKEFNTNIIGNVIFGGIIGIGIDTVTGNSQKYTEQSYHLIMYK
jgi:uncharacterized protein YceK